MSRKYNDTLQEDVIPVIPDTQAEVKTPDDDGSIITRPISKKGALLIKQAEMLGNGTGYIKFIPEHVRTMPNGVVRTVAAHSFVAKVTEKIAKARAPRILKVEDPRVTAAKEAITRARELGTKGVV